MRNLNDTRWEPNVLNSFISTVSEGLLEFSSAAAKAYLTSQVPSTLAQASNGSLAFDFDESRIQSALEGAWSGCEGLVAEDYIWFTPNEARIIQTRGYLVRESTFKYPRYAAWCGNTDYTVRWNISLADGQSSLSQGYVVPGIPVSAPLTRLLQNMRILPRQSTSNGINSTFETVTDVITATYDNPAVSATTVPAIEVTEAVQPTCAYSSAETMYDVNGRLRQIGHLVGRKMHTSYLPPATSILQAPEPKPHGFFVQNY
ncbi:hypothetical protein BCR39DRAFT_562379 [Naematelia encephala]|uniref:Uncharacterized protein n=1 Tax=Naematelia encephala TaxID=71784 RepID=A0A1Y2AIB8_9TREE|nr:hypothetical protein BCR39DRAFT_562379 [Naematelia encephala]